MAPLTQNISLFGSMPSSLTVREKPLCWPFKSLFIPDTPCKQQFRRNLVYASPKKGFNDFVKVINGAPTSFPIKKRAPVLIQPATKTCNGLYYLSRIDQDLMCPLELLYSYRGKGTESTDNTYKVIKEALAEILVHFYPLAGRLTMTPDESFMVNCTGEGVHFVEAVIDQDLDEFGDISTPNAAKLRKLVYIHETTTNIVDMPLLAVQVTMFKCGGFVIGITLNHCMMDGTSIDQFMNSWAEIARGTPLSILPFLDRSILKPKQISETEFPQNLFPSIDGLYSKRDRVASMMIPPYKQKVYTSVQFGPEKLMQLKKRVIEEGIERIPTNFELLSGLMSRAIIRSRKMENPLCTKLLFAVNARGKLGATFPKGYFGNCTGAAYIMCKNEEQFLENSLSSTVIQVQEALRSVTGDSIKTLISYAEAEGLQVSPINAFAFSNIARMSVFKTDFGLGEIKQFGFATLPENDVYFLPQKKMDRNNVTVVLGMSASEIEIFQDSIKLINVCNLKGSPRHGNQHASGGTLFM